MNVAHSSNIGGGGGAAKTAKKQQRPKDPNELMDYMVRI